MLQNSVKCLLNKKEVFNKKALLLWNGRREIYPGICEYSGVIKTNERICPHSHNFVEWLKKVSLFWLINLKLS